MFRQVKLKNRDKEFKCELMKNRREALAQIPGDYISQISYRLNDTDELTMEIADKIVHNGKTIKNPVFNKVKNKRFLIVNDKEKYVINKISTTCEKSIRTKKVSAVSFEEDLAKKDLTLSTGISRQLYRLPDEKVLVGEGVLNMLEQETDWKIGYVDKDAMFDTGLYDETEEMELYKNLVIKAIKRETVIFEKDVDINIGEEELRFSISYSKIKCTNDKDEIVKDGEKQKHDFNKFAQGITKIKATYGVNDKFEEVIKYEFTLKDGFVLKKEMKFTYLDNMNVEFGFIYLSYCTGRKIEQSVVKIRWFDQGVRQWLDFLRKDVSDAYDCTIQFDTLNKIINVVANKNLGTEDKGLYLSYDNYITGIDMDEDSSEVITRLVIEGKDGLTIGSVNPLGTNYIEDFSYLIKQGNMSDELQLALERYNKLTEEVYEKWFDLREQKNLKNQRSIYLQSKLLELTEKKKVQEHFRITYMKQEPQTDSTKKRLEEIKAEIDKIEAEINKVMQEMNLIKNETKVLDEKISILNSSIVRENSKDINGKIFTQEDLEELDECVYSSKHQDDFYTTANGLFENGKLVLKEKNKMPISFKTDLVGITRHPRGWKEVLQLGQKGIIDDKDIIDSTEDGMVMVTGFTYIPPRKNMNADVTNIEFTNKKREPENMLKRIGDIGKKSDYSKTMTDFWKGSWHDSSKTNDFVKDMREAGLDTATSIIKSKASINSTEITETGVWIVDRTNGGNDNQIYLGAGMIGITQDGWNSCSTCIDSHGVIAEQIIGSALLGEKLVIANKNNTIRLDEDGLSIYDELGRLRTRVGFYEVDGVKKASLLLMSKDGKTVMISEDGMSNNDSIISEKNLDSDNPLYMPLHIPDNVKEIRKCTLFLHFMKYQVSFKGTENSTSVTSGTTSGASSSSTTSSGGGVSTSTVTSGGVSKSTGAGGGLVMDVTTGSGTFKYAEATIRVANYPEDYYINGSKHMHGHVMQTGQVAHTHEVYIRGKDHTHDMSVPNHSHSFSTPNHSHNMQHTHSVEVSVPGHTHKPIYKIFQQDSICSNVSIEINGVEVIKGLQDDSEIDITKYLKLNQLNKIYIKTSTNGRLNAMISMQAFNAF
ncbi:MAG: hypothetical protein RSC24_06625 [Clostridium sp.]